MPGAWSVFFKVFVQTIISLGGTLVYAVLLIFISRIVDDLKLEVIFKRLTPFSKVLVTLFLAGIFLAPFNLIYSKLYVIITSGASPLARVGQVAEGLILVFVLYIIYKSFRQTQS